MKHRNVVVFISDSDSNMEALAKVAETPGYPTCIAAVISEQPQAGDLEKQKAGIFPFISLNKKPFHQNTSMRNQSCNALPVINPIFSALPAIYASCLGASDHPYHGPYFSIFILPCCLFSPGLRPISGLLIPT